MSIDHPYPLAWPVGKERTPNREIQSSRFNNNGRPLTISRAVDRLMTEIRLFTKVGRGWRIDPDDVIISSNLRLRKDGLPISNQREPDDVGIAVYLDLDGVPHCFPCDAWDRIADNIAAIAAHLGALRSIERWGVGDLKTAFAGWTALEHKPQESWWKVLQVPESAPHEVVDKAYKKLRSAYHPDRQHGDVVQFQRIQLAYEQYEAH